MYNSAIEGKGKRKRREISMQCVCEGRCDAKEGRQAVNALLKWIIREPGCPRDLKSE
jgi:hypothetical protein